MLKGGIRDYSNKMQFMTENYLMDMKVEKETIRSLYFESVKKMVNYMIDNSLNLKKMEDSLRSQTLQDYIQKYNRYIYTQRKRYWKSDENITQIWFGILFPFQSQMGKNYYSTMIVNFVAGEGACFNTKKRVPYLIYVETIDRKELKNHQVNISQTYVETSSQQSKNDIFDEINNYQNSNQTNFQEIMDYKTNKYAQDLHQFMKQCSIQESNEQSLIRKKRSSPSYKRKGMFQNFKSLIQQIKYSRELDQQDEVESVLQTDDDKQDKIEQKVLIDQKPIIKQRNSYMLIKMNQRKESQSQCQSSDDNNDRFNRQKSDNMLSYQNNIEFLQEMYVKNFKDHGKSFKFQEISNKLKQQEEQKKKPDDHLQNSSIVQIRSDKIWGQTFKQKYQKIKNDSKFKYFKSYELRPIIIKGGDDLRQELIVMQLINKFKNIFDSAGLSIYVKAYEIIVTGPDSGVLEFVKDTQSLDSLKKKYPKFKNLRQLYENEFEYKFEEAQKNFIESLAGASLMTYFLQIKDRHNGNILIDCEGRIVHIDFGFVFCTSPGNINFEKAPFKLTQEYIDLMEGTNSQIFFMFKMNFYKGFLELRKYVDQLCFLLEIMRHDSDLPCFKEFDIMKFKERFKLDMNEDQILTHTDKLIQQSSNNWRTIQYDNFQKMTNGILQ